MKQLIIIAATFFTLTAQAQLNTNIEKYKLKNGLEVVMIDYGNLPVTSVTMYVNTGRKNETPGLQSIAGRTASGLVLGNAKHTRVEQDDIMTGIGAGISASSNDNYSVVQMQCLNKDMGKGFEVFAAATLEPTFPEAEIKDAITQDLDFNNPGKMDITALADMYSDLLAFGSANPLGRHFYAAQVNKIGSAQVKEFYKFNYTPGNSKLVICGKFDKGQMKTMVEQYYGSWKAEFGENNGSTYDMAEFKKKEYNFVNRSRASQAALNWTKKAPAANSKDVAAFVLADFQFNKILFDEIRAKEGKTYGINSRYSEGDNNGTYQITTQVRSEVMYGTTQSFDRVLNDFYTKGITEDELKVVKVRLKNRYLSIETPEQITSFFNPILYPDANKRKEYLAEIDKLDLASVNKVIKKYFTPSNYKLVISGDESVLNEQLQKIQGLNKIDLKSIEVDN